MAAAQEAKSYIVQCSPDNFEHASWLSAVFSEVLSINEVTHRLHISQLTELLQGQLEKLGARVTACFGRRLTGPA